MDARRLFDDLAIRFSRMTTQAYSTSFSLGIRCFKPSLRDPIYAIYAYVRYGDEIVDTLHGHDKLALLNKFRNDTMEAIRDGVSLNPVLHGFQMVVNKYGIEWSVIEQFLKSMEMDISMNAHDQASYEQYIFGSAEVVGLMCLRVFIEGDEAKYHELKPLAMRLGSALQKINFLRDLNADYNGLGRMYFPGIDLSKFDDVALKKLEEDISSDFRQGLEGIRKLPNGSRLGVYVGFVYFRALLTKIMNTPANRVISERIRIRNRHKLYLLATSYIRHRLNIIA